jgi:hypothetical protein
MNKGKKIQLLAVLVFFILALAACLGMKYYNTHLPEETDEEKITVTDMDTSLITGVEFETEEDSFGLVKEAEDWQFEGDADTLTDEDKIETFLGNACSITAEQMIEDVTDMSQYGLDAPALTITLTSDQETCIIKIGDQNALADGCYYLSVNDENTVYTINSYKHNLLNKSKDNFVGEEETTEEETTEETEEETAEEETAEEETTEETTEEAAEETTASE